MNSKERMMLALNGASPTGCPRPCTSGRAIISTSTWAASPTWRRSGKSAWTPRSSTSRTWGSSGWSTRISPSSTRRPGATRRDHQHRPGQPHLPPHDPHAGGDADLQDRRRPEDDLDHRVPHQAGRGHRSHPQVHAGAAAGPSAHREALRRGRRCGHPARLRVGRPGRLLAARRCLMDVTELIYAAIDQPEWVHAAAGHPAGEEAAVHRDR